MARLVVARRAMALTALAAGIVFIHLGLFGLDRPDAVMVDGPPVVAGENEAVAHN